MVEVGAANLFVLPDLQGSSNYADKAKCERFDAERGFKNGQYTLGILYRYGVGIEKDHGEAVKWLRRAADQGHAKAQYTLGVANLDGNGAEQDFTQALKWLQLAATQADSDALTKVNAMQQRNLIPALPPGTAVTTILLTSAKAATYDDRRGRVVEPTEGVGIKPDRAAVLLDGEVKPISFKLMNLRT